MKLFLFNIILKNNQKNKYFSGQKFAMLELKSMIAHLLYNFNLEPFDLAHEVPIVCDMVLRPARPIYVKIIPIRKSVE